METSFKIFLVDDDPFSLTIYKGELEHSGYKNISMHNSSSACFRHLSEKPKVIFLDHNMDEMDGLDLLRKIRNYYPDIHVIMVSGKQCVRTAVQALKCGAYDYIIKGDNEVRRMKAILRQLESEEKKPERETFVQKLTKNQNQITLLITCLFILQSGVIAYHYSSLLVSVFVTIIILLVTIIAFSYKNRVGSELI